MSTTHQLLAALRANPDAHLHIILPDDDIVPAHFHVTEVGRVQKDFIDCGGTTRTLVHCQLQLLVASDVDHRLTADKLLNIFELSAPILGEDDLPLVLEHEDCRTIAFPLREISATPTQITLRLDLPHPACLAADSCGLPSADTTPNAQPASSCCAPSAA